jgi:hypothetical protein
MRNRGGDVNVKRRGWLAERRRPGGRRGAHLFFGAEQLFGLPQEGPRVEGLSGGVTRALVDGSCRRQVRARVGLCARVRMYVRVYLRAGTSRTSQAHNTQT